MPKALIKVQYHFNEPEDADEGVAFLVRMGMALQVQLMTPLAEFDNYLETRFQVEPVRVKEVCELLNLIPILVAEVTL